MASNPLLEYQPAYTYSMPTQLLIHGVVLTLLTVLLLHLLFTAKYHYPLAPCNFLLLLAAVILTQLATLILVMLTNLHLFNRSRYWPFMFDYIEVTMPLPDWNLVPLAGWYIMQGAVTFLAHATHIQFLTLLFPSSLERRLILAFLAPLCVFASVLFFTHFLPNPNYQDLGDAIRNTATSTLSLLYTFGLLIWGYVVNRKRAWEHEGGTFGFGVMSISLALVGTAANFIEVREDRLKWLPWLVNTVLLWQSWAGFWWWVGAGMWSGEVKDIERREAKKRRREEKRQRKRSKMFTLISHISQSSSSRGELQSASNSNNSVVLLHPDPCTHSPHLASSRSPSSSRIASAIPSRTSTVLRRLPISRCEEDAASQIELDVLSPPLHANQEMNHAAMGLPSHTTETSSSTNDQQGSRLFSFLHKKPMFLRHWLGTLSEAHNEAAKQQARTAGAEQAKRFGIRAMTQRVIMEGNNQRRRTAPHDQPPSRSSPRTITTTNVTPAPSSLRNRAPPSRRAVVSPSDSDNWVSYDDDDDEEEEEERVPTTGSSGNSHPHPSPHAGTGPMSAGLHHSRPAGLLVQQQQHPDRYTRLPKVSPRLPTPLDIGLRREPPASSSSSFNPFATPVPVPASSSSPSSESRPHPPLPSSAPDNAPLRSWRRPLVKVRLKDVTSYD
ncbi:hypothetical protein PCANC_10790 [Puccinia coronata f. sp. avenae]|uniref:Uncharacterized protein n=1 Tax=Puccinia coronata f. sp. avenae TaxID=200324 RepID=A0A2N5V4D2_9BASI|nr:hypothetical protein PCANC_10790 [Puccinia coronata f. sp. avenae]